MHCASCGLQKAILRSQSRSIECGLMYSEQRSHVLEAKYCAALP